MNRLRGKLSLGLLVLVTAGIVGVFSAPLALADSKCGGVDTAIISCDPNANGVLEILKLVLQILTGLVGIAAVGALIFAGILYSSASGEQSQVQKAKTMIQNTVIGIILFGTMFLVGNWLIPGGVFGGDIANVSGSTSSPNGSSGGNTGDKGDGVSFTAATYNIKCSDSCGKDAFPWTDARANAILSYIKGVDVVGIQEGRETSVKWLTSRLKSAGYSRSTNEWAREVFWKQGTFTATKQGVKELDSEKDLVWAKLQEKSSGKSLYFVTVHLDVNSSARRVTEAKTAIDYMKSAMSDAPIVFVGDMNSNPGSVQDKTIQAAGFKDAYTIAKTKQNITYKTTLNGYNGGTTGTVDTSSTHQIDHIYIKGDLSVSRIEITTNKGSDHVPVEADIVFPGTSSNARTTDFSKVTNFRDAGTSGYIKTGLLYRSANLVNATTEDKSKLTTLLDNGAIIDLREPTEPGYVSSDPVLDNVANMPVPIHGEASISGYKKTFINNAAMRKQFGIALTDIANSSGPALVHCKAGKDRTGWLVALAMMSVGVKMSDARKEYLLSPNVDQKWFDAAYQEATNNTHTGGSGKILDFIKRDVSQGGLGVNQDTIDALQAKLKK